ncbi:enoyl-CoA hydratase/isomerase family protein [Actinomadura sp. HBU206391]|uniref:enoyl-CoA hydratase/isomerase family protein n=1 Tax=Actinomadura sp. HBU206391 TaxID=2731692 RepID=UPI00164F0297|nr:enoyl-CoA hydratase/isomerase family protein [Actinomadura sp. HBU206391]MBC6460956.1 enoyl-CoA hydratase/isomerase family protein [Actinomadura sp. HBU206391]
MAALTSEISGGIATITIDNPAKRNAMTAAMWRALPDLLNGLAEDESVRVLVLTGSGAHFCSGADISDLADVDRLDGDYLSVAAEEALAGFPKPTIAAIQGYCVGGGCLLAAACDLRFAAANARFGITPARFGLVYPVSATARLVGLVGSAAAKYLLYSAELIDAAHALRIGLTSEVVDRLDERVAGFAAMLTTRSQLTLRATKDIVDALTAGSPIEERVGEWLREARAGDAAEGVSAFLERRPPRFTWNGTTPAGPP